MLLPISEIRTKASKRNIQDLLDALADRVGSAPGRETYLAAASIQVARFWITEWRGDFEPEAVKMRRVYEIKPEDGDPEPHCERAVFVAQSDLDAVNMWVAITGKPAGSIRIVPNDEFLTITDEETGNTRTNSASLWADFGPEGGSEGLLAMDF